MDRLSQTPVMKIINDYLGQWPEESDGYIIALPAEHLGPMGQVRWYTSYDKPEAWSGGRRIMAAGADQMHKARLYATYKEAWEETQWLACHWAGGRFADGIRIVRVTRRPPLVVHSVHGTGVLDALADV